MRSAFADVTNQLEKISAGPGARSDRARRAAVTIRDAGGYRWVGLYDVGRETISVLGWDGPHPPTYPTFPVTQGLNGAAVATGEAVIVQDVTRDPRYLTTLGSTRAEMIMPVRAGPAGAVVGTIDVESDRTNPFTEHDRELLGACVGALAGLWRSPGG
ncbi:MAG: GAF domain-containing protein [Gemmatimonadales bacterium]